MSDDAQKIYGDRLGVLMKPNTLGDLARALEKVPHDVLDKFVVFRFHWGDEHASSDWKRKETPKQYSTRILTEKGKET